jgi:protein-disulfide isomerase
LGLCAFGLVVSEYLLLRTFAVAAGAPDSADFCSVLLGRGCDETLRSSAGLLGLPVAAWGVLFFGTVGLLLVAAWALDEGFARLAARVAVPIAVAGALAGLWMSALFVLGKAPFCPLCTATHVATWALVPVLWSWLRGTRGAPAPSAARAAAGLGSVAVASLLIWMWASHESAAQSERLDPRHALREYARTAPVDIPVDDSDPLLGHASAKARIVVFSDFRCAGCQAFAPMLHALSKAFGDRVAIRFKHFPLSSKCNPGVADDRHPGACALAAAAHAAHLQGRFWPFHDRAFEGRAEDVAKELALDVARFEADRRSDETRRKLDADIALGLRLGVDGTPSVFVNGRRVRDLRLLVLGMLVQHELEK